MKHNFIILFQKTVLDSIRKFELIFDWELAVNPTCTGGGGLLGPRRYTFTDKKRCTCRIFLKFDDFS